MTRTRSVSIVVLTHGKLEYTRRCFECIEANTENYELVVVDNASTDGTREYLLEYSQGRPNVKVLLSDQNLGFAGGCNRGVAAAKHGTICLLNNDTEPHPGWLDALEAVFGKGVGAVGAKLLLPDGTIQHAGIEFKAVAQPTPHYWPYHRYLKEPGDLPEANVFEEVPAVTAACLLTNKMVWKNVGGMDEGYLVANYEDVDFNLAVRAAGLKVLYQPESQLLHHWGTTVTSKGTGPDSPAYWFQHNFNRLMTKWFDQLASGLAVVPGSTPSVASRRAGKPSPLPDGGLRIVMTLGSYSNLTGSELYVYELSRELVARGHEVTVVSSIGGEIMLRSRDCGVKVHEWTAWEPTKTVPDVLHVNHIEPSRRVLQEYPGTPAIMSIHSELDFETPLMSNRIDTYVCIRPEVQRHVVSEHGIPESRTAVIYNPIDFGRFYQRPAVVGRDRKRVLFVGTIDPYRRNGILDLVRRSEIEDFDLQIAGERHADYLDALASDRLEVVPARWDIEELVAKCDETAGALLGRTTIEGWACGKPGWIYDLGPDGEILDVALHAPPTDMTRFDSRCVAEQIEHTYRKAIRGTPR